MRPTTRRRVMVVMVAAGGRRFGRRRRRLYLPLVLLSLVCVNLELLLNVMMMGGWLIVMMVFV